MANLVTIDLDRLRSDIAQKRREIAELEAIERAASNYAVASVGADEGNADAGDAPGNRPIAVSVTSSDVRGKTVAEAAAIVLNKAGDSLKTRTIVDALERARYPFGSTKNIQNAVFTAMARKPAVFMKTGPGFWELVEYRAQGFGHNETVNGNGSHDE